MDPLEKELSRALQYNDLETVEKLVPQMDMHRRDEHGNTYLMSAAYFNYIPIVRIFVEAGSDINAVDQHGNNVLQHAAMEGGIETAYLLYSYGVKLQKNDPAFIRARETAIRRGFTEFADFLKEAEKRQNN